MRTLTLHIDGSSVTSRVEGQKAWALGWGFVAHHDDLHVESSGATFVEKGFTGYHEMLAFVEAVIFANARGFAPQHTVIFTDDEQVGYAGYALHPENYQGVRATALQERLQLLTARLYTPAVHELAMQYLRAAQIHKLRGHTFLVYQERADHLARSAAWGLVDAARPPALPFSQWLQKGIEYYRRADEAPRVWIAPFVEHFSQQATG